MTELSDLSVIVHMLHAPRDTMTYIFPGVLPVRSYKKDYGKPPEHIEPEGADILVADLLEPLGQLGCTSFEVFTPEREYGTVERTRISVTIRESKPLDWTVQRDLVHILRPPIEELTGTRHAFLPLP